ncbi:sialin-like [Oratosquilla oratoria]|uniref:sialin-like n=1 Tax=Oratosquilla oratoria TaxID=337810 RepID=UPI003F762056
MGFFGFASAYSMRVNLSVAIVAMVKSGNNTKNDSSNICPAPDGDDEEASDEIEGEFEWDEKVQGLMLGAFFYGYVLTNVLGGRAAEYFGGKKVFGLGIVLTGLFTVVSPVCAWVGPELFFVSRFAQGLTETLPVPWRAIFTSMPFYAILVLHFGNNWGFYTLLTEIPTYSYLNHIQHFDLKSVSSAATS